MVVVGRGQGNESLAGGLRGERASERARVGQASARKLIALLSLLGSLRLAQFRAADWLLGLDG